MKLFILADPACMHTKRWVAALATNTTNIFLFGLNKVDRSFYEPYKNVTVYTTDMVSGLSNIHRDGGLEKLKYIKVVQCLKRKLNQFQPDILHAHYASSYGLLGALSGFHPYIISVWGSDVYDFPNVSFFHRQLLKYNLSNADYILSTSHVMAKEVQKYTEKNILITPFGVDLKLFKKMQVDNNGQFIIGNVKTLLPKYGIDVLIRSFKKVVDDNPQLDVILKIIGEGDEKENLIKLCQNLGVYERVKFLGRIDNCELVRYYNEFSVAVFPSVRESFGVVAVESMACECPVVVSDADGFTEVVVDKETGFVVPKKNIEATTKAIQVFIDNRQLRENMGRMGRKRVEDLYDWNQNVQLMLTIYRDVLRTKKHDYSIRM